MKLNQQTNRVKTPFGDFQIDVDNLVDHFFGDVTKQCASGWSPRVSVSENETGYAMTVELPGVFPEDVSVEMQDGTLEISGVKKISELDENAKMVRDERQKGEFKRSFEFSTLIDSDRIEAVFKNGLLALTLPKSEKVLPRKIDITVSE